MRTARVFYLLLSVLQFIFFLKLVEYVRGEEIPSNLQATHIAQTPGSKDDVNFRGMFIAPNIKRKKLRAWNNGKNSNLSQQADTPQGSEVTKLGKLSNSSQPTSQSKRDQYEREVARLCPACDNNMCPSINPISSGFPIVPVIIAVITGIAWFILFLIAWIFHTRPNTKGSGGYEGGYGSPQPEYGAETEKSSIFDHFLKPNERSLQSYATLHSVLDSIGKLSDLYNSY